MPVNYYTITEDSFTEIEIKKSRFLTHLYPVTTQEQAESYIQQLKKEHYKANHHCWAYIIGEGSAIQRMSDDGEPTGTAGIPMLEVLKKQELTNMLAVVVRYFGGIKLGGGGLIRAYSSAVSNALTQAVIMKNISLVIVNLQLAYSQVDQFNYYLQHASDTVSLLGQTYGAEVEFRLAIYQEHIETIHQDLINRFSGQLIWQEEGIEKINIPL